MEYPKKIYMRPIRIIMSYLVITLILYAFGPFKWVTYHPVLFWGLNIAFLVSLWLGWTTSLRTKSKICERTWDDFDEQRIARHLKPFIWINIIFELLNAMRRFRFVSFDIAGLFNNMFSGLGNFGLAYSKYQTGIDEITGSNLVGGSALTLFSLAFSFFSLNIVILCGALFKQYKLFYKILIIFMYVFIALEYVATGTNIGAFRIVLAVIVIIAINFARSQKKLKTFESKKRKRAFIIITIIGVITVLSLFNEIMQSRGGILLWQSSQYNVGGIGLDRESFVFRIIPSGLYMLIVSLSSYLSQGYYGMSLSLNISWEPGFGLGHTKALQQLFSNMLKPVYHNTYQYRLNGYGWDENVQWHTLYSWFANDFTYFGVILVVFLIGYVFCKAYSDSLVYNSPYAKLVTYYYVLMCIFIPCNNQVFQSTYVLFGFIGAMVLWVLSRKGIKIKVKGK